MIKRLIALGTIILWLSYATQDSYGAVASSTIFDVNINGGDDLNGGGCNYARSEIYNPKGVDYSNQDLAQAIITDAMPFTSTAGTQIYFPSNNCPTLATGNIIHISSANNIFTQGFYEITAVASGGVCTVDRNCNVSAGTGGIIRVGGRWKSLWYPQNTATGPIVAGNIIYIKSGTYTKFGASTSVLRFFKNAASGAPIIWEGYNNNRNDRPLDNDRPILDGQSNTTNCLTTSGTIGNAVKYLITKSSTSDSITGGGGGGTGGTFYHVKSFSNAGSGFNFSNHGFIFIGCEMNNNSQSGYTDGGSNTNTPFVFCYAHNNTSGGILNTNGGGGVSTYFCISESNSGIGINNERYGSNFGSISSFNTGGSSDGFYMGSDNSNESGHFAINCIAINNGRDGIRKNFGQGHWIIEFNDAYGNGASNFNVSYPSKSATNFETNPLFKNSSAENFELLPQSPCIGTGYQRVAPFGVSTQNIIDLNWNIGVDQGDHQTLSAGSVN